MKTNLRVLIVEDSEDDTKLLLMELRHGGWDTQHERVDTPQGMKDALENQTWDLIIADYSMPCFSGSAALAMARLGPVYIPFILVSGLVGEEMAVQAMKAGADDYLFKGNIKRLVPAVERELGDAERRQEARLLEVQLRKKESQLAEAQRMAHVGTWHADLRTGAAVWSDEAARILGAAPENPAMTFQQFLACLRPSDKKLIEQYLVDPARRRIADDFEVDCPESPAQVVHIRGEIRRNQTGAAVEATGMIQDITERYLVDLQLKSAKEAAEAANRAKSEFLANMSHEIRTPMTAIVGFADLMLKQGIDGPDRVECVQVIQRNARHLMELINEILDLSKIEAGQMTVAKVPCDLPKMLGEIAGLMRCRAEEKGLAFKVSLSGGIPRFVFTDPLRFRQILVNLVGNAVKFTEHGTIEMTVGFENTGSSRKLLIDVIDSGIGLTPEQMEKIFEPFTQGEESTTRKFGGTGLGLTISRRLARILGGNITVTSQRSVGSNFRVWIDGGVIEESEMLTTLHEGAWAATVSSDPSQTIAIGGRILLVEDGRDNQRLLSTHLKLAGAQIDIAENGQVALDLCNEKTFDLILMDMQMPVMDGYTAAGELRRRGVTVPIIALTAYAMSEDRAKCIASGCDDYLTKPVDAAVLLQAVRCHLGQSDATAVPMQPSARGLALSGSIKSTMLEYPGMARIIAEFIHDMPAEVCKMQLLLETGEMDALRRQVHQLRGSGGGYGFPAVTAAAASAEEAIIAADDAETIASRIATLAETIRRLEGFEELQAKAAA